MATDLLVRTFLVPHGTRICSPLTTSSSAHHSSTMMTPMRETFTTLTTIAAVSVASFSEYLFDASPDPGETRFAAAVQAAIVCEL